MTRLYPTLMLTLAAFAVFSWFQTINSPAPGDEGTRFLKACSQGNLGQAVRHFGGNTCRCPAKGGWGSYLVYASGQEPNLAFLVGHPFQQSLPRLTYLHPSGEKYKYVLPWEKPEDTKVDVDLNFNRGQYSPYFLPLQLAYGKDMTYQEFLDFLADPAKDAQRGFTLRLRPSLGPGAIRTDESTISQESKGEFRALEDLFDASQKTNRVEYPQVDQKMIKEALGDDALDFLTPKDCGQVMGKDGTPMPMIELVKLMPRLDHTTINLHVVRVGKLERWTIFHFSFENSELSIDRGNRKIELHS